MNITPPDWNAFPVPNFLDCPQISPYASHGWCFEEDESSGLQVEGYGDTVFKKIGEISVRTEKKKNVIQKELEESQITVTNKKRITLGKGVAAVLQEQLGLVWKVAEEGRFVCFACTDYVPFTSLQGDHFQSKASLIERMKAYWNKLNTDSAFYERQKKNPLFEKMFCVVKERLNMRAFFVKGYINSEDNIWPLCDRCNGLALKKNSDPLTFLLNQKHFGPEFLRSLPPLNTRSIIIRAGEKQEPLAQFAIRWFADKMKKELLSRQLHAEIEMNAKQDLDDKLKEEDQTKTAKMLIRMEEAAYDSDSSEGDFDPEKYRAAFKEARKLMKAIYHQKKDDV